MSDVPPLPPQSPPPAPGYPPPQPSNGSQKVLIGVLGGVGLLLLMCCGGAFGVYWVVLSSVRQVTTKVKSELDDISQDMEITDPTEIVAHAKDITDIDIPAGLAPKTAARIRIPSTDRSLMSMAAFVDQQEISTLVLAQFNDQFWDDRTQDQFKKQFEQMTREQGHGQEEVTPASREEITRQIRGREVTFVPTVGEGKHSGQCTWHTHRTTRYHLDGNWFDSFD